MLIMEVHCMQRKSTFGSRTDDAGLSVQYFFEDTVTAERYQYILMQFVSLLEINERNA